MGWHGVYGKKPKKLPRGTNLSSGCSFASEKVGVVQPPNHRLFRPTVGTNVETQDRNYILLQHELTPRLNLNKSKLTPEGKIKMCAPTYRVMILW